MKKSRNILCALFALIIMLSPIATVYADSINGSKPSEYNTLMIWYKADDFRLSDTQIKLYKVADITAGGELIYTDSFTSCGINVDDLLSRDSFDPVTSALSSFIALDGTKPFATADVSSAGCAKFVNVTFGVYFVDGFSVTDGVEGHSFGCVLFNSFFSEEAAGSSAEINVYPKSHTFSVEEEDNKYRVTKLWRDNENRAAHPQSVEVVILKNGAEHARVILSNENDWTYEWTSSEPGAIWNAAEVDIPKSYTAEVNRNGNNFTITNTFVSNTTPDTPKKDDPDTSSKPNSSTKPSDTASSAPATIGTFAQAVKTGLISNAYLWILLLAVSGGVLILLSASGSRKEHEKK